MRETPAEVLSKATARVLSTFCLLVRSAVHGWNLITVVPRLGGVVVQVKHRVPVGLWSDLEFHIV